MRPSTEPSSSFRRGLGSARIKLSWIARRGLRHRADHLSSRRFRAVSKNRLVRRRGRRSRLAHETVLQAVGHARTNRRRRWGDLEGIRNERRPIRESRSPRRRDHPHSPRDSVLGRRDLSLARRMLRAARALAGQADQRARSGVRTSLRLHRCTNDIEHRAQSADSRGVLRRTSASSASSLGMCLVGFIYFVLERIVNNPGQDSLHSLVGVVILVPAREHRVRFLARLWRTDSEWRRALVRAANDPALGNCVR